MLSLLTVALTHGALAAVLDPSAAKGSYEEKYFTQTLDHFDPTENRTYQQRYLYSAANWDGRGKLENGCNGPILIYTGNEGPIDGFWSSNGFMIDVLAPKWGALLVFPEERYFGKSLPFGAASFKPENAKYLTTEQVLADYVAILDELKSTLPGARDCPAVAFGGSYGGTLTTFLRASYPYAVVGGLAASAPIGYYDRDGWAAHGVDEFTWYDIVLKVYREADPQCLPAIQKAVTEINAAPTSEIVSKFHVCEEAGLGPGAQSELFAYALEGLPQENYPYALGDRPAWPVNWTCDVLVDALANNSLIDAAARVTNVALGGSESQCLPTLLEGPGGVPGDGPGPDAWGFQSCTENLHEFSARGIRNYTFDMQRSAVEPCDKYFDGAVRPDPRALTQRYGGYRLGDGKAGVSNLIWSNGALDPWGGGGFLTPGNPEKTGNHWIYLEKGAHHLDLRGPHPDDPPQVTQARAQEEEIIRGWIEEASRRVAV